LQKLFFLKVGKNMNLPLHFVKALEKNGSFAFASRVGLCGWGKSKCAVCGLP